jgi:hypothetical protein
VFELPTFRSVISPQLRSFFWVEETNLSQGRRVLEVAATLAEKLSEFHAQGRNNPFIDAVTTDE